MNIRESIALVTVGVVAAGVTVWTFDHDESVAPVTAPVTVSQVVTPDVSEDEAGWNCLTMGNRVCGPDYVPVVTASLPDGGSLMDVLSEDEPRDWSGCLVRFADTTVIVCADGMVVES